MTKKFLLLFLLLPLLLAGCAQINTPEAKVSLLDNKTILFYGDTCPHCKVLEQFIDENKIGEKMVIEKLEVFENKANANLMLEAMARCSLPQKDSFVPFLWTENKCFVGSDEAINFFKLKFKI